MASLQVKILTPQETLFAGEVSSMQIPGFEGRLGVLPQHAPLLGELKSGPISLRSREGEKRMVAESGFFQVKKNEVIVLLDK